MGMRVISQNRCFDVPYDEVCFELCGEKSVDILARSMHITSAAEIVCMATYSTEEKAKKAMKRLHKMYDDTNWKVFQFPQEDEIE